VGLMCTAIRGCLRRRHGKCKPLHLQRARAHHCCRSWQATVDHEFMQLAMPPDICELCICISRYGHFSTLCMSHGLLHHYPLSTCTYQCVYSSMLHCYHAALRLPLCCNIQASAFCRQGCFSLELSIHAFLQRVCTYTGRG
jgi:hypothetical protein